MSLFPKPPKTSIAQQLNIPRLQKLATGSDIQNSFDQGNGVDKQGERIPFTADNPAILNNQTYLYETPDGSRIADFMLPDGRNYKVEFSESLEGETVGEYIFTAQMMVAAETLALAQPIFQRGIKISHGGHIDIHFDDIVKAKRVAQALLGDTSGYDGTLLSTSKINRLKKDFQAFRKEGDWVTGDNDPARATKDFQELGIVDTNGPKLTGILLSELVTIFSEATAKVLCPIFSN